jgi:hypothetical protein
MPNIKTTLRRRRGWLAILLFGSCIYISFLVLRESTLERWVNTIQRTGDTLVDSQQSQDMYFAAFLSPESDVVICYKFLDQAAARITSLSFKDKSGVSHDPTKTVPLRRTTWYGPIRYQHLDGHAYMFAGHHEQLTVHLTSHKQTNGSVIQLQPDRPGTEFTVTLRFK